MKDKKNSYQGIFKSTFLFGFVQIFNILTKVLLNKFAAVYLGSEGIGLIGIFQSISQMLKTLFGLGVSQSAVRDISKANNERESEHISSIIGITHKIILLTSVIGGVLTVLISSYLSRYSFGDDSYKNSFILLSLVVMSSIFLDGKLSVLKGMRHLRDLAKATVFGSVAGICTGIPMYYFFGLQGIIPTILATTLSSLFFATYYVSKINYNKVNVSLKEILSKSRNIIKMGVALMIVTFIGMVHEYIVKIYVSNNSSVSTVGVYQAGLTIVSGYFSIIIVAMMADYYPRISAIFDKNEELALELNKQSRVGLILITPLIVLFMFLMPVFVRFLYSVEFLPSVEYMRYAIFWTLIIIVSNPIDMILVAKQNTKVFLSATILYRITGLCISIYLFDNYNIKGLGIAMLIMGVIHITLMQSIMYKLYRIHIDVKTIKMMFISIVFVILSFFVSDLESIINMLLLGLPLVVMSFAYSINKFNEVTNVDLYEAIKAKLRRKMR